MRLCLYMYKRNFINTIRRKDDSEYPLHHACPLKNSLFLHIYISFLLLETEENSCQSSHGHLYTSAIVHKQVCQLHSVP